MGTWSLLDLMDSYADKDTHTVNIDRHIAEKDKPNEMFEDSYDKKNFSFMWIILIVLAIIIGYKHKDIKSYVQQNIPVDKVIEYIQGTESKNIEYDSIVEGFEYDTAYGTLSNYIENYPVLYYALSSKDKKMYISYFNDNDNNLTVDTLKMPESFDIQFSGFTLAESNDNVKHYYNTKDIFNIEKYEDNYKLYYNIKGKEYYATSDEETLLLIFPENTFFKAEFWEVISNIINKNYAIVQQGDSKGANWVYYTFMNSSCIVYSSRDTVG